MTKLLFVGEKPSKTAHRKGWTWESGRLAAKPLFEALRAINIQPESCGFVNLFGDRPTAGIDQFGIRAARPRLAVLKAAAAAGVTVIALGNRVSFTLAYNNVSHHKIRHPAARGAGRLSAKYAAHVADVLGRV